MKQARILRTKAGFTILEVTLVLAIAGLIIAIVLFAQSALSRAQRDRAASDYAGQLIAAIQNCNNDNCDTSTGVPTFLQPGQSLPAGHEPKGLPSGWTQGGGSASGGGTAAGANQFIYSTDAICGNDGHIVTKNGSTEASNSQIAVSYWSLSGGTAVCKQSG